jgi:hypothetical protein
VKVLAGDTTVAPMTLIFLSCSRLFVVVPPCDAASGFGLPEGRLAELEVPARNIHFDWSGAQLY